MFARLWNKRKSDKQSTDSQMPQTYTQQRGNSARAAEIRAQAQLPSDLEKLQSLLNSEGEMNQQEMAWAHGVISEQPPEQQDSLYLKLQEKTPYANQRDNDSVWRGVDNLADQMCNLTALAMCLQYLGVPKPTNVTPPVGETVDSMQYEDALFQLWMQLGKPGKNIIYATAWQAICTELGRTGEKVSFDGKKSSWESVVRDQYLAKGHGVMVGGFGHVVRVQAVNENGVIVDDPFGKSTGPKKGWSEKNTKQEDGQAGNDSEWVWPNEKGGLYLFHVK